MIRIYFNVNLARHHNLSWMMEDLGDKNKLWDFQYSKRQFGRQKWFLKHDAHRVWEPRRTDSLCVSSSRVMKLASRKLIMPTIINFWPSLSWINNNSKVSRAFGAPFFCLTNKYSSPRHCSVFLVLIQDILRMPIISSLEEMEGFIASKNIYLLKIHQELLVSEGDRIEHRIVLAAALL